jgi:hypothetical protein
MSNPNVRPVAQNCYDSLILDVWPRQAAIVDFALDSDAHYAALQSAIKAGATVEELDAALGNGVALTALVKKYVPSAETVFSTAYDDFPVEC